MRWLTQATLIALGLASASAALGQHKLDSNLAVGTRYNTSAPRPAVQKSVYTVNEYTGDMTYNRANAFNDSTYSIYQRYTGDRIQNFTPAGTSTGSRVTSTSVSPTQPYKRQASYQPKPLTTVSPLGRSSRASNLATSTGGISTGRSSGGGLGSDRYSAARPSTSAATNSLSSSKYSVAR